MVINRIISNDWLRWVRDNRLKWLCAALFFISGIALWNQVNFQSGLLATRLKAQEESRREWLAQELKHPHMAAHFGNYAYKKPVLLHCFDPGLSVYTGTSVYMEPHRQNDFIFSKSQESDTGIRFGWLSPALVCQLILPLLIILFSFDSVNGERESGTLPMLISQGASFKEILLAKTFSVFIIFEMFFTLYVSITVLISSLFINGNVDVASLFFIWLLYSVYCLCWCFISVILSAKLSIGKSIAFLLLTWVITTILVPRISANVAENAFPLITNYQFKKQIAEAIEKGLNGHDPGSERALRLEKGLLANYNVDSVQQLPFNFEGYIMQQGEEYSSRVYDYYFDDIFRSLKNQKKVQSWFSLVSPYIAVRNASMAATNASLESEIDFQQQAEHYRREFVQSMNSDMKDNSAYGSFETYRVKKNKYAAIDDLHVASHSLSWAFPHVIIENILVLIWPLALVMAMLRIAKKPVYS